MKLTGKVVFITGAGKGIGKASALVCAGYGAKIVVLDIKEKEANETVNEIKKAGGEATAVIADIRDRNLVKNAVNAAIKAYEHIDVLFNSAGVVKPDLLHEMSDENFNFIIDINFKGTFIVSSEVAKVMIPQKKGRIINASSIAGSHAEVAGGAYCTSKAAVSMMTQVMALELGEYNISAVAICPGHIDTTLLRDAFIARGEAEGKSIDDFYEEMTELIPLGRLAQPSEVGEFIAFLCDDRSYYIDGCNLLFDGGRLLK